MNNHFGVVLGVITVSVIGGAVVLDHFTDKQAAAPSAIVPPEIQIPPSTPAQTAAAPAPAELAPTPSVSSTTSETSPSVATTTPPKSEVQSQEAAKTVQ